MNDEIIVNFTPTGLIPTKEQTEFVPISCNEIVEDVLSAYEEGITTVHLHARHEDGSSAYEAEAYAIETACFNCPLFGYGDASLEKPGTLGVINNPQANHIFWYVRCPE